MQYPIIDQSFQEAKRKAKELYSKIDHVWCPILGEPIVFNKIGFQHLVRKGKKRRSLSDQRRRFSLLAHVKDIIENPDAKVIHREGEAINFVKRHGEKAISRSPAEFWAITGKRGGVAVTVVVRETGTRKKHFYSVYGNNSKKQKAVG